MKRLAKVFAALVGVGALYLFLWPVSIDPIAWDAPAPKPFLPTGSLTTVHRVPIVGGHGPEDIDVDPEGRVYAALADGRILRWTNPTEAPEVFANTNGRPLGLHWDPQGRLVVADATQGLLRIDAKGVVETLTQECGGKRLVFTDDLDVAEDGTIWFSDASLVYGQPVWRDDIIESRAHGRLCAYDPSSGRTREVVQNLFFANGIAIDPDQQFVLVNETSRYRVRRYWLAGKKRGQLDTIIDNLPGFPDGISTGTGGLFWIAIASPRSVPIDKTSGSPFLRRAMYRLPLWMQPKPKRTARAIAIDASGRVVHDLFDPNGEQIRVVTSVQERNGRLYFGSLVDDAWGWLDRPLVTSSR